jgi:hypothetical protein
METAASDSWIDSSMGGAKKKCQRMFFRSGKEWGSNRMSRPRTARPEDDFWRDKEKETD